MNEMLANDLRTQYGRAFSIIREIVEKFPEDRWLEPHGDIYYIPSRIAYHLAVVVDGLVAGGFSRGKEFADKLPYGNWMEATAATLPDRKALLAYYDDALGRAEKVLAALTDEALASPIEPAWSRIGASQMGMHLCWLRELSDHTGELNKMLIEDGVEDIWK